MFLQDNTNKCTITDSLLFDNLKPYNLVENNGSLYIDYDGNKEYNSTSLPSPNAKQVSIKFNILENLIKLNGYDSLFTDQNSSLLNIWLPLFVSKDTSDIENKLLTRGTSIEKNQLGIENFLSFAPELRDWSVSNPNSTMTTDWILNSPLASYNAEYGILCWIKYTDDSSPSSLKSTTFKLFEAFPVGSRLRTDNTNFINQHFIKITNDKLLIINKDDSVIDSKNIVFDMGSNVILASDLGAAKFLMVRPDSEKFIGGKSSVELWVPDGDFYTYLEDEELDYDEKISSRSYLSPCLYNKYIQIYHILTLDEIKYFDAPKSIIKSRSLKRLAYALATSPLMDNVCHNFLNVDVIKNIVQNYLNNTFYASISSEKIILQNCLIDIFYQLRILNEKLNKKTLNNNYIVNRRELFKKLTNKYTTNLTLKNGISSVSYNKLLAHGDHILINQSINSYCAKNTPAGTTVFNNQTIQLNNIVISTDIGNLRSEINLNNTKILPLTDIIKETYKDLKFSIGPDQIYSRIGFQQNEEAQIEIEGIIDGDFTGLQGYMGPKSYTWEQISGPCLRFSDYNRDSFRQIRFTSSTDYKPNIYVYGPGVYVIKCTVITDLGTVSDTKTIYVINADELAKIPQKDLPKLKPASISKIITGGLKVMCPNINTMAIHKRGMFWPIKTDLFIGKYNAIYDDQFIRLQGQEKFVFKVNKNNISHSNSKLTLIYNPNNTVIKISRYILQNMRDETEECAQCKSFYKDLIVSDKSSYFHRQKYSDQINLPRYIIVNKKIVKVSDITFDYPEISTKFTAPIKNYGGFTKDTDPSILTNIVIPNSQPSQNQNNYTFLPTVTGHNLIYKDTICYESNDNDYISAFENNSLLGIKCSFVPNSGIIGSNYSVVNGKDNQKNPYINKSTILKFNPGSRTNFVFKGAGFKNLSASSSGNYIIPSIYRSSITLNIEPSIVPDIPKDGASQKEIEQVKIANQKKELKDHDPNHGYRYLNNGLVDTENDEFKYSNSSLVRTNPNCEGSNISYSFTSLGPKKVNESELQEIRVPGFSIKDLSVKLNFLNYVNTKNLIVWLDVDLCSAERAAIIGPPAKCPLKGIISPDQYCGTTYESDFSSFYQDNRFVNYFSSLSRMNYNPKDRTQIRLYLLNQEHIENNTYNFSLEFSDDAPKSNRAHNFNIGSGFVYDQNIIPNNSSIRPTTMAFGYSDNDNLIYRNIIDNNKLSAWFNNNSFQKFKNFALFNGDIKADSSTKFTLNIAVVDEPDQMRLFDNINNNDLLSNFKTSINKQESSYIYNSLCSWELYLNVSDKTPISKDINGSLGLIDYTIPPTYPGYTFLTSFDKNNSIIPTVNTNAPNTFLNNTNLCRFQDYESFKTLLSEPTEFPIAAVLAILGAASFLYGGFVGAGITIAGLFDSIIDPQYKVLSNYFTDRRRQQTLEEINQFFDRADYTSYPFGSPEKVLISVAKPGYKTTNGLIPLWYKMEASIFKSTNLPVLEKNKYKFIKVNKKILPEFSRFSFQKVSNSADLIDRDFLNKFVVLKVVGENIKKEGYGPINNITLKDDDIINVVDQTDGDQLYTIYNGKWYVLPNYYYLNRKLSQYVKLGSENSGPAQTFNKLNNFIKNNQLILVENRLAFDLFNNISDGAGILEFYNDINDINDEPINAQIDNIFLIIKNNKFYTLIHLDRSILNKSYFSPQKDFIFVFKNDNTTIYKNQNVPLDIWGLEKTQRSKTTPIDKSTSIGIGSYGDGNPFVNKQLLSESSDNIKLPKIYDQFINNDMKTRIISAEIIYPDPIFINGVRRINYNGKASCIFGSLEQKSNIFVNNEIYLDSNISEELKIELYNSIVDIKQKTKNYFYMYLENSDLPNFGEISFSNDLIDISNNILKEDTGIIDSISKRLETLQANFIVSSNLLGIPRNTDFIIKNGSIEDLKNHYNLLPDDTDDCYNTKKNNCYKKLTQNFIDIRILEKNHLLSYIELRNKSIIVNNGIEANNYVTLKKDENNTLYVDINNNRSSYIINIDPKQECSIDTDLTFKILKKITYQCVPLLGIIIDPDTTNICARSVNGFTTKDASIQFTNKGDTYEYKFDNYLGIRKELNLDKDEYWKEFIIEREFFINANGPRDTLVKVTEYYDIINDKHPQFTSNDKNDGSSIPNRVYNICNLDNTEILNFKFKNIPRKLKGIDKHYDRYIPNKDGQLVRLVNPSAGGPVHSNIRFWKCLDTKERKEKQTTPYLKLQNEMIYRAFFNSIDGVEHKINIMESLYPWEWIPYEYDF